MNEQTLQDILDPLVKARDLTSNARTIAQINQSLENLRVGNLKWVSRILDAVQSDDNTTVNDCITKVKEIISSQL